MCFSNQRVILANKLKALYFLILIYYIAIVIGERSLRWLMVYGYWKWMVMIMRLNIIFQTI